MSDYPDIDRARQRFAEAELPFPHIPEGMRADFTAISDFVFGTRADAPPLFDVMGFVEEVATREVADYLMMGFAGRDGTTSSYAIHYFVVRGPLALFLQRSWGGLHDDNEQTAQLLRYELGDVEALIRAVDEGRGQFEPGERLIGIASDFNGCMWTRTEPLADRSAVMNADWREERDVLRALLAHVRG